MLGNLVITLGFIIASSYGQQQQQEQQQQQVQSGEFDRWTGSVLRFPRAQNAATVDPNELKSFVSIERLSGQTRNVCGGILLDVDFVLTTASCLDGDQNLNVWNYALSGDKQSKVVRQVFAHPEFNATSMENDIAVLNISPYEDISELLTAVEVPVGQNCTMVGWGQEGPGERQKLFKIQAQVRAQSECNSAYETLTERMLCVKAKNESCLEMRSSALLCDNEVAGLLSFGVGCTDLSQPNVFTDVSIYNGWIDDVFRTTIETRVEEVTTTTTTARPTTRRPSTRPPTTARPAINNGNREGSQPSIPPSKPKEVFETVYTTCSATFVECISRFLGYGHYRTSCRRGYYEYGCFYVVKRYVVDAGPQSRNGEPSVEKFERFLQNMNKSKLNTVATTLKPEPLKRPAPTPPPKPERIPSHHHENWLHKGPVPRFTSLPDQRIYFPDMINKVGVLD